MMSEYGIPGAALGVVHAGHLVYLHGYGNAARGSAIPVDSGSRFRIASISKPITAAAILLLVEQGKLSLDTKAFDLLAIPPPPGATVDPRISTITIKELLEHRGGWDRDQSFDPMFESWQAASDLGTTPPADCATIARWMLGFPLDFDPGTRSAYSNFGYCILGLVIAKVTGMSYGAYVQQAILDPLGMTSTSLGHTLQALTGEVHYYDYPGAGLATSVFDGTSAVPWPYGGFYLEAMDAHGGWVSTPADLLRFLTAVTHVRGELLHGTFQTFGLDFGVIPPTGPGWWWYFEGSLPGTRTILALDNKGNSWALVTNTRRSDTDFDQVDPLWNAMGTAIRSIKSWPKVDLFGPAIKTVTPSKGYEGTNVKIKGTGFTGATSVRFAGTEAVGFHVDSGTQVTAAVPPGAVSGHVTVTTPAGLAPSSVSFAVLPPPMPVIKSFTPASGHIGTTVMISGSGFTGSSAVRFHGTNAQTFTIVSDTKVTAVVAGGTTTGTISITTGGGTATSAKLFSVG